MRTLTKHLAPHPRAAWLTFLTVSVLAVSGATVTTMVNGGGRVGVTMTVFVGVVLVGVLAAVLDAILLPGNPDMRGPGGYGSAGGWAAGDGVGGVGGVGGGGDCGGGGASCP